MNSTASRRRGKKIMMTAAMLRAWEETVAVHEHSPFVVWAGRSRVGKTTTARWLRDQQNQAFELSNPEAFRAHYLEVGRIDTNPVSDGKLVLRSVFHSVVGRMDEGTYRQNGAQDLAAMTAAALGQQAIEMLLVDEAGMLSVDALRGLALLRNIAESEGSILSIVLIGMDDLPVKIRSCQQLNGRTQRWVSFAPYSEDDSWDILAAIDPEIAGFDRENPDHREIVHLIHRYGSGLPGEMVAFLSRARYLARSGGSALDAATIRATNQNDETSQQTIDKDLGIKHKQKKDVA